MEIWQDGVLAGLAAVGLTALVWLLAGALFRWRERPLDAVYVVALTGGAEKLDMTLRELARERRLPVVLVDGGLTAEGRIASFSTVLPDQPNALATYLAALSHEGVNVLEVYHERSSMKVGVGSCRVRMVVETRNHEHIHQLYSYLAERGYTIKE